MPARAVRPPSDRDADRTKAIDLAAKMRLRVDALTAAITALPAKASRTPAQQRDALIMNTLILVVRFCLITSGAGTAADRTPEAD